VTERPPQHLAPLMPALLDALGYVGSGVLIVADKGGVLERWYANEPAAAILGYQLPELLALPPFEVIAPEQRTLVRQLTAAIRAGQPVPAALEIACLHKQGHVVVIELAMGHSRLSDDAVAFVMVVREVSKVASQLTLLEADRIGLVGTLAAGFAHEINNPLTSVLLNLRSLRKHLQAIDNPAAMRCLDDITTGSERIASNVRALQTLATRSASQELDLAAVASSALRLAAPTLEAHAHVIRQIFPVRPVLGEESRVGQAVLAMLLFAGSGFVESASGFNRIVILVEERGADVVIEVSDNGRELAAEESRHAFDPFFRSPTRGAGMGVGLGVARSVAAALGGNVQLSSRPGGGAVITMRLPAAPA
jgi:two-component system, NtrC family, sensor kinase